MSCRIYLVRHGLSEWNKDSRYQGHTDIPLSEQGREQARLLSQRMERLPIDAFYSSDLCRARETAQILSSPHGQRVHTLSALRELSFGSWEGLTAREIKEKFPDSYRLWAENPLTTRPPSGETYAELACRVKDAISSLVQRHIGQSIAVVAHGGTIRCIVGHVLGLDLSLYYRLRPDNASLSVVEYTGGEKGILLLFNDVSHLQQNIPGI